MTDFTYINVRGCENLRHFEIAIVGSKGTNYKVTCVYGEWHCPCEGFKFRNKCRHVNEASQKKCNWSEEWGNDKAIEKNGKLTCPECGGDTFEYRAAV